MTHPDTRPRGAARLRPSVLVASGLGSGFSRLAPGTVGSLVALPPGILLSAHTGLLMLAILAACAAGLWAIPRASAGADHGWIVIDEIAGQWITLLGLAASPGGVMQGGAAPGAPGLMQLGWIMAAFLLFRLLDITKPGPIGVLDRRHDAFGVMGDDVVAGLAGAALLGVARLIVHGWAGAA